MVVRVFLCADKFGYTKSMTEEPEYASLATPTSAPANYVMAWLQLARVSALPSAISNILMGFLLAQSSWQPVLELLLLVMASSLFYSAGMILNDVFDYEVDSVERPQRPLPSGRICRRTASIVGFGSLVIGLLLSVVVCWLAGRRQETFVWLPLAISILLVVGILLYDGLFKKRWFAPLLMGGCRTLNILLGASTIGVSESVPSSFSISASLSFTELIWWVAISIGIYVTGVTLFARKETSEKQNIFTLGFAAGMIGLGLLGIGVIPWRFGELFPASNRLVSIYPWLILLIMLPILRSVIVATFVSTPKTIQAAIVTCLRSLIVLDASVAFMFSPDQPQYAMLIAAMLLPAVFTGIFVRPT